MVGMWGSGVRGSGEGQDRGVGNMQGGVRR